MTIIYIILIITLLGILWHIFCHLMAVFHKDTTDLCVKKILENPHKYLRAEEMCYFFRNIIYLYFVIILLLAAYKGNIRFEKTTNSIEINNIKNK